MRVTFEKTTLLTRTSPLQLLEYILKIKTGDQNNITPKSARLFIKHQLLKNPGVVERGMQLVETTIKNDITKGVTTKTLLDIYNELPELWKSLIRIGELPPNFSFIPQDLYVFYIKTPYFKKSYFLESSSYGIINSYTSHQFKKYDRNIEGADLEICMSNKILPKIHLEGRLVPHGEIWMLNNLEVNFLKIDPSINTRLHYHNLAEDILFRYPNNSYDFVESVLPPSTLTHILLIGTKTQYLDWALKGETNCISSFMREILVSL